MERGGAGSRGRGVRPSLVLVHSTPLFAPLATVRVLAMTVGGNPSALLLPLVVSHAVSVADVFWFLFGARLLALTAFTNLVA